MKCEITDCAETFNGNIPSEYGGKFRYGSNDIFDDDSRKRKLKVCKKCINRPIRELFEALLERQLSESEIKEIDESNIILNLEKSMANQI